MNLNRGVLSAPRFTEPIAMALMGAGFFVFIAALAGGGFWQSLDGALWRLGFAGSRHANPEKAELDALVVKGGNLSSWATAGTEAQRRLSLARDIDLLAAAGAKAVVLEAWLDDASQGEAELLLDDVLSSSSMITEKASGDFRKQLSSLKERLNADKTLAASISRAANVLLPVLVEARADTTGSSVWPHAGAYQVSLRAKGTQNLEWSWRPSRMPLEIFGNACAGLAAVAPVTLASITPDLVDEPLEVPGVFQVGKSWVNGLALEAARLQLDIPSKGMHFLWRNGNLSALELKSARHPFNARGTFWIPWKRDRPRLAEFEAAALVNAPWLKDLRGKVVFYQPWPELLTSAEAFQRQQELFAAFAAGRTQRAPASRNDLGLWSLVFLASLGCLVFFRSPAAWGLPVVLAALSAAVFYEGQRPLARALGSLGGACLAGLGSRLLMEKQRRQESLDRFKGVLDPSALPTWVALLEDLEAGGVVAGAYLAVRSAGDRPVPRLWEAWAKKYRALVDMDSRRQWGFVLPIGTEAAMGLDAAKELVRLLPGSGFSFALGQIQLRPVRLFSLTRWTVDSEAKSEAVKMSAMAAAGELLITESDYAHLREKVKVQLKGELVAEEQAAPKKILNILGVY